MQGVQYGNLYRFVASLGVLALAAAVTVPWFFITSLSVLTVPQDQLDALTPVARQTIELRQQGISMVQVFIVALALALLLMGVSALWWSITRWSARQLVEDEKEDVDLSNARRDFEPAGSDDVHAKTVEEAAEFAQAETEAPDAGESPPDSGGPPVPDGGGSLPPDAGGGELQPEGGDRSAPDVGDGDGESQPEGGDESAPGAGGEESDPAAAGPQPLPRVGQRNTLDAAQRNEPDAGQRYEPDGGWRYEPDGGWRYEPDAGQRYEPDSGWRYEPDAGQRYEPDGGSRYEPDGGRRYEPDGGVSDQRLKDPAYLRAYDTYRRTENRAFHLLQLAYGAAFDVAREMRPRNSRGTILDFLVYPRVEGAWGPFGLQLKMMSPNSGVANVLREGMTGLAEATGRLAPRKVYLGHADSTPDAKSTGVLMLILDAEQRTAEQMRRRIQELVPPINAALNRPVGVLILSRQRFDTLSPPDLRSMLAAGLQGSVVHAL